MDQQTIQLALTAITAVAGAVAAVCGVMNHITGKDTNTKVTNLKQ